MHKQHHRLSQLGQTILHRLSLNTTSRMTELPAEHQVIDMTKQPITSVSENDRQTPQQLLRNQLPGLTRQLLGKRYDSVSRLASMVVPFGAIDMVADQAMAMLTDVASLLGDSYQVLNEAGVNSLAELQHDPQRSGRLAGALGNQNKVWGMVQGAVSGVFGTVGAVVDLPLSLLIALRTIYLTGRAYGFELDQPEDRALIYEALAKVDLSLVAEKQAIFLGLKTVGSLLNTRDLEYLQNLVGSNNSIEPLRKLLSDDNGQLKWNLNPALFGKLAPLAGGAAGAVYNARFLEQVAESAREVFEAARLQAMHQPAPKYENDVDALLDHARQHPTAEELAAAAQLDVLENSDIEKVEVKPRRPAAKDTAQAESEQDQQVQAGIDALAETLVKKPVAKPRATRAKTATTTTATKATPAKKATGAAATAAKPTTPRRRAPAKPAVAAAEVNKPEEGVAKPAPRKRAPAKKAPPKDQAE